MPFVAKLRWWLQQADAKLSQMDHVQGTEVIPPRHRYDEIAAFVRSMDQPNEGARGYLEIHIPRIARTLELVPAPHSSGRVLEMGAYMQMTPALQCVLGYKEVRAGLTSGPSDERTKRSLRLVARKRSDASSIYSTLKRIATRMKTAASKPCWRARFLST